MWNVNWYRVSPIGIGIGTHKLKFVYDNEGDPMGKKAVIDTFNIMEGVDVDCLIYDYTPAKPATALANNKILRGNTKYQKMSKSDVEINFKAYFNQLEYHHFMSICQDDFYFKDEFGTIYRGIFDDGISPELIVMNNLYSVSLALKSDSIIGKGFL
ncbi:MAG: hypothetical protein ATN35_05590 [Epulopiscium sp. Nele67-Bin004]|nr:MAG: hypothetical protein ATN35_05590 [Epulopiscium sp. Nele67-Bin004]